MEDSCVSKTLKSTYAKNQIEDDDHLFLWPRGDRTPGICPTWNNGQCRLLLWCSKKMCGARDHRNGKTRTSLSTTTMLRLTGPLECRSFFCQKQHDSGPPSPILIRSVPLWLFPLPQAEASDEGSKIRNHWRDSRGIAEGTWQILKRDFQKFWDSCIRAKGEYVEGDGGN